jgi:glutamate racemase
MILILIVLRRKRERLAAPELVDFVEHRFDTATAQELVEQVRPYMNYFREKKADTVVLGCTHFILLKKSFRLRSYRTYGFTILSKAL